MFAEESLEAHRIHTQETGEIPPQESHSAANWPGMPMSQQTSLEPRRASLQVQPVLQVLSPDALSAAYQRD